MQHIYADNSDCVTIGGGQEGKALGRRRLGGSANTQGVGGISFGIYLANGKAKFTFPYKFFV